jgi:ubiquinone biosynthesis protein
VTSSLKARHAPRYLAVGRLLLKHRGAVARPWDHPFDLGFADDTGSHAKDGSGEDSVDGAERDIATVEDAKELATELVRMGPTFVKLGQLLSTRADLLPPAYLQALSRLREEVEPLPAGEAERVIEEELGARVSKMFGSFESKPFAAASLGQVHKATLRDGRPVAVKVQRPGIRQRALEDMEVIAELAAFLDEHSDGASSFGLVEMVNEFEQSLVGELDYRREAANQRLMGEHLSSFERIVVPQPVGGFTTSRVLTMDYLEGRSLGSIGELRRIDVDCSRLAEELISAYLDMVLVNGFFHADPHPGNLLLTDDGRLALIDLGMISRVSPEAQGHLLRLLLAMSSGDGTETTEALEHLGTKLDTYDREHLRVRVNGIVIRYRAAMAGELQAGRMISDLATACSSCGLRPDAELSLLAKALLSLDEAARLLDPEIQLDSVLEAHSARVMRHKMMEAISPANVMRSALDAAAFVESIPRRLNKILESLSEGKLTINLEGLDEAALLRGAQKLANRVATGVLIAAFVLAAALFSRQRSGAVVWGYPILTVIFLGLAMIVAVWLAFGILRGDLPRRRGGG